MLRSVELLLPTFGTTCRSHLQRSQHWALKMGRIRPETSETTILRCIMSHKSEDLIYSAGEPWNLAPIILMNASLQGYAWRIAQYNVLLVVLKCIWT